MIHRVDSGDTTWGDATRHLHPGTIIHVIIIKNRERPGAPVHTRIPLTGNDPLKLVAIVVAVPHVIWLQLPDTNIFSFGQSKTQDRTDCGICFFLFLGGGRRTLNTCAMHISSIIILYLPS